MGVFKSMAGMVLLEMTSADVPGTLRGINGLGISVFQIQPLDELTVRFRVYRKDYRRLCRFAQARGAELRLCGRQGIYWRVKRLLGRPVLTFGMGILILAAILVPSRVFFVRVEGNHQVPANRILEAASEHGIGFGASRRAVRSEKVKNALLSALPELQWAGVNTSGCVAVISVRERDVPDSEAAETGIGSIVAARDGVIVSCTVTRGSGLCVPGQAVRAGQALISGYTDCGRTITAVRAQGEVMAETRRNLTACTPSETLRRTDCQTETVRYSLLIGKKRINFFQGSGISDGSCVKMKQVSILTLPGGFRLPAALIRETVAVSGFSTGTLDEATARARLAGYAAGYLRRQMIAGQILSCAEFLDASDGLYRLTGEYACTEMIGRFQTEQIGEYHGKTD
ncbi:MAG: sporulation protein YqfD [Clostridiales bacterium]|nr:sporulation protein YqfD [Clostridiales bacterium]MDD7386682.1 sporulation protein YqfD [Bacillota bacterium]MDY6041416.1 sporulation protein YqfD [Candidatus Faecousia sp.]